MSLRGPDAQPRTGRATMFVWRNNLLGSSRQGATKYFLQSTCWAPQNGMQGKDLGSRR